MLGLRAVGFKSRVIPVRVIEEQMASPRRMLQLIRKTVSLLCKFAPDFPFVDFLAGDLSIRNDCLGEGYAHFTEKAVNAADLMNREAGIILNGTYSAKAFSAVLEDAGKGVLKDKTVLFWNTYNSRDLSKITAGIDYHQLPAEFHCYFEEDVQPLDRANPDR
jgi:1-aminocyclopropane-1-carboxylate deaminase/D-cysteine desulfhydrase-like pyridoxal-dependent ACC family enzyme